MNIDTKVDEFSSSEIFENLPKLIKPGIAAQILSLSTKTIYDWRCRPEKNKVPLDLFLKFNKSLYIRTDVLKRWIASQNLPR